jgi:WD40 repeat protein
MQNACRLLLFVLVILSSTAYAQLRIVSPNGGEVLIPGNSYSIQWTGIPATNKVNLEFSSDGGIVWNPVATKVAGLSYSWTVPNTISTSCLLRAVLPNQIIREDTFLTDGKAHSDLPAPSQMIWGPGSNILAFGGANKIFDVNNNLKVLFDDSVSNDCCLAISPDEQTVILRRPWGADMFDIATGNHLRKFDKVNLPFSVTWLPWKDRQFYINASKTILFDTALVDGIDTLEYSNWTYSMRSDFAPGDNRIVMSFGSNIKYAVVFDATTLDSLFILDAGEECTSVKISANNLLVATFGKTGIVKIWNVGNGALHSTFTVPNIKPFEHAWSYDNILAIGTQGDSVQIWDAAQAKLLTTLHCPNTSPHNTAYTPQNPNKYLITQNSGHFYVFDAMTYQLLQDFDHWSVSPIGGPQFSGDGNMQISPDGKKIALRDVYGKFIIFYIDEQAGQSDISDNQWSINNAIQATFPIRIGIDSAFAGEIVYLPVILNDVPSALAQGATSVRVNCSYNTTMLEALADPNTNRDVAGRVDFAISLTAAMDTVIGMLPFRAGLGNAASAVINIQSATTNSPSVTLTPTNGLFTLRGVCFEGGARLMNPSGVPSIVMPSTAFDASIPAEITTIEEGRTKLYLVDLLGRTAKIYAHDITTPAKRKLLLDLTGIANGKYLLILETPTKQITRTIEVAR